MDRVVLLSSSDPGFEGFFHECLPRLWLAGLATLTRLEGDEWAVMVPVEALERARDVLGFLPVRPEVP